MDPSHSTIIQPLESVQMITEILIFPGFLPFSMIFFMILKFHDISMTGKAIVIFPGFQGFPGAVGTLTSFNLP